MLSITKYTAKYLNQWNDFVIKSNNGTLFHNRNFLEYHLDRKFIDHSLLFFEDKILIGIIPAAQMKKKNAKVFFSHPGASYGGLVLSENLKFKTINKLINLLIDYCSKSGFINIVLINTPSLYFRKRTENLDYLLQWNGFRESETYISHITDLTASNNPDFFLGKRKKRYIRNILEKTKITCCEDDNLGGFYAILSESKKQYNSKPTHSLEEIKILMKRFPDKIKLFISYDDKKIIGGMLLFILNTRMGLVFYNVIKNEYRKTQTAALQLFEGIKFCKSLGLNALDFGVSHTPELQNPLAPKFSLIEFKEQFGANGVIRKVYMKDIK